MSIRCLARAAILSGVVLAVAGTAAADVFLKAEGIPGDALYRGFEGQIMLTGASLNISSFTAPDPNGFGDSIRTMSAGPLVLTKTPDRSSPKLMMAAVEGAPLGSIEITFTSPLRAGAGAGQQIESRWILEGAEVRSFNVYPDMSSGGVPTETIEIAYSAMRYQYFTKDAKGQRSGAMEEVKWKVPDDQAFPFDEGCR